MSNPRSKRVSVTEAIAALQALQAEGHGDSLILMFDGRHPDHWVSPEFTINTDDEGDFIELASPKFDPDPPVGWWTKVWVSNDQDVTTLISRGDVLMYIKYYGDRALALRAEEAVDEAERTGTPIEVAWTNGSDTKFIPPPAAQARFILTTEYRGDNSWLGVTRAKDEDDPDATTAFNVGFVTGDTEADVITDVRRKLYANKLIANANEVEVKSTK